MDDHLIDDASFEPPDVAFDELLRDRLAEDSLQPDDDAAAALVALRSRFVRARRLRRAQLAATIAGPLVLVAVAVVSLPPLLDRSDGQATVAAEPDVDRPRSEQDDDRSETIEVTGTTIGDADPVGDPSGSGQQDGDGSDPAPTDPSSSSEPSPSSDPALPTSEGPTPTSPPTSTATTVSPTDPTVTTANTSTIPGSELGQTVCGSILVRMAGGGAELVETRPKNGYRVDVKATGPEVEVSFEREGSQCEIRAEVERGEIVFEPPEGE